MKNKSQDQENYSFYNDFWAYGFAAKYYIKLPESSDCSEWFTQCVYIRKSSLLILYIRNTSYYRGSAISLKKQNRQENLQQMVKFKIQEQMCSNTHAIPSIYSIYFYINIKEQILPISYHIINIFPIKRILNIKRNYVP